MNIENFSDGILFDEIKYTKELNFIKVEYKNSIISIETPLMKIPFGIKKRNFNYYFQICVDEQNNDKNNDFLTFINMLEKHAKENVYIFLKEKQFISKIYKNDRYPSLVNINLTNNSQFMNEDQEKLCIDNYINKYTSAVIDFTYNGIWFNETQYGLSFKADKIIIKNIKEESKIKIIFNEK